MDEEHFTKRTQHARNRARERYGFEFDKIALAQIRRRIEEPDDGVIHLHFHATEPTKSRYAIWHCGEWLPLVYDSQMRSIVTSLPASEMRKYKHRLPW